MMNTTENQYDAYCKKVLRFKSITAMILKSIIEEFKDLSLNEIMDILNSDNITERMSVLNVEDITKPDAKIFYDLLYHIPHNDGMFVDLEPQGKISRLESFLKRCIHTGSRMIVWQRKEKDGSFKEDFSDLKKCVSIWIVIHPPKELRGEILDLNLSSNSPEMNEYADVMNTERIFIMCLHDDIDVTDKSALMMLSVLFSSKLTKEERIFILKEEYDILLSEAEREDLNHMCNAHEGVLEYGKEMGIVIGRKDGIEIGRKDGIEIGRNSQKLESAKKLLMIGASIDMVVNGIGLSYETVEKLYKEIKQ